MATARVALGSLMNTVAQTANSVSALVNTTTKGVGMLDSFVTKAADEQALRHKKSRHTFIKNLIREASEEEAQANIAVIEFCNKSADHKKQFEVAYDEFNALFAEELQPKSPE